MRLRTNRRIAAVVIGLGLAVVTTACSTGKSSDGSAATGSGGSHGSSPTKVTIGAVPIVDVAPLYLGVKKGFYAQNGIDLTIKTATGGAALLPAVISGGYQFGFSEVASLIVASSKGLPITMITPASFSTGDPSNDYAGLIVGKNSSITKMTDLAGKKVAINSIQGINYVLAREAVDRQGGDSSKVKFVEMNFPDMLTALDHGQIDAAFEPQPFYTIAQNSGDKLLFALYANATRNFEVTSYFTTKQYAAKNAGVVARFKKASDESMDYAQTHPAEARSILATFTTIDPKIVANMTMPKWPTAFNMSSLNFVAKAAQKYGLTEKTVDVSSMVQQ